MDPMNQGLLNLFETMINGVFCRDPNVNMIQQWVSNCSRNQDATSSSHQESSDSVEVKGNSTPIRPIMTGSLKNISANNAAVKGSQSEGSQSYSTNENCFDTAHSGGNLIGKNA